MPTTKLVFSRGDKNADQIQSAIDVIMSELEDPLSETRKAANKADIDLSEFTSATVEVREADQGAEPILTAIIISVTAKAASAAVTALWQKVLWPRLIPLIGVKGVGPEKTNENAHDGDG